MARFNKTRYAEKVTVNYAGGRAYKQDANMELVSILLTSFMQDQFYRTANETQARLTELLAQVDAEFAAKAAVYARREYGMRSVSHYLAANLVAGASGQDWGAKFYDRVVRRPDDMLEIMAAYQALGGKNPTNAMKKGFAAAFNRFDGYQLAKYRGEGKGVKLVDVANLVHPVPSARNAEALKALVADTLRNTGTWEAKLSAIGQADATKVGKDKLKAEAWAELIANGKLGYLALIRNLRNMAEDAPAVMPRIAEALVDERAIRGSLVMPFQLLVAKDAIAGLALNARLQLGKAIDKALELSLANVPRFEGRTLVVLDDSGSMSARVGGKYAAKSCLELGVVFAAALVKSNDADLMRFSDDASYVRCGKYGTMMEITTDLIRNAKAGGTNFHSIFKRANWAYDRIIILSDMQGWVGYHAPTMSFEAYKERFGADPFVYSFDLAGYGSTQLPEDKVFCLAGFSDKVFDTMKTLETDRRALVNTIMAMDWDA